MPTLAARLLEALPQTQCTRCGYPDCAGYAQAMAQGEAPLNRCPPGGVEGIARLSSITGLPVLALDPDFGAEAPRQMAFIDEPWCIGCTLCIEACPVDAIVGSHKLMHTVIEAHCTGCELCIPVCPVDCIVLEPASDDRTGWAAWSPAQAGSARDRYANRRHRLQPAPRKSNASAPVSAASDAGPTPEREDQATSRRAIVEAAMARARARRTPPAD